MAPLISRREEGLPAGSDASAGTYVCSSCGFPLVVASADQLLPCRCCHGRHWRKVLDDHTAAAGYPAGPGNGDQPRSAGSGDH